MSFRPSSIQSHHKLSIVLPSIHELDIPSMSIHTKKTKTTPIRKMRKLEIKSPAPKATRTMVDHKPKAVTGKATGPKKDIEKRLATLHRANDKLREKSERLTKELASLREEENAMEQERDRLQQLWMVSREETEDERESRHNMEKAVQRMKTVHEASITQLQQKMHSLLLAARTQRVSSTQTELVYVGGPFEDREVQTVEELNREKAAVHLRQNDAMLVKMIDDLEREKLNAQSDLKYAIVQLEQRMKEEKDSEIRRLRDEKLRHLDEISIMHAEELRTLEEELWNEREKAKDEIARLETELATMEDDRDQLRIQLEIKRGEAERAEDDANRCRRDKERMEKEHAKLLARSDAVKRDASQMEKMKREAAKYREINEILMAEYTKMEEERDEILEAMERGVNRLENVNHRRNYRLKDKLDEIDRRL